MSTRKHTMHAGTSFELSDLAKKIDCTLIFPSAHPARAVQITGINAVGMAEEGELTFITHHRYKDKAMESKAAAVIVGSEIPELNKPQLVSKNPYASMAKASSLFYLRTHAFKGQSPQAFVHPEAVVHPSATIFPWAYIDARAKIGKNTVIYPHVYIGLDAQIGDDCVIWPSTTIMHECVIGNRALIHANAVIGADGFGFAPTKEGIEKIPQIGRVVLGDDVEIGPTTTIDRGAYEDTVLANGCKVDSQVHVAHGVQIGEHSMLCGQAAIAGSARIGSRLIMTGHSAIGPGVQLGSGITLGPKAGMIENIQEPGEYIGFPAVPAMEWRRQSIAIKKLPELLKTINQLSKRIEKLEAQTK